MTDKDRNERYHVADSGYEVEVVAKLTGLSRLQVFNLIKKHGKNRANQLREAKLLKDRQTVGEAIVSMALVNANLPSTRNCDCATQL
jgi:hypothetical protein